MIEGLNIVNKGQMDTANENILGVKTAVEQIKLSLPTKMTMDKGVADVTDMVGFGSTVYAVKADSNNRMYKSTDEGLTWTEYNLYTGQFTTGGKNLIFQPRFLAIDKVGITATHNPTGKPGGCYAFGRGTTSSPTVRYLTVVYQAPGANTWTLLSCQVYTATNGEDLLAATWGFSVGRLGMGVTMRVNNLVSRLFFSSNFVDWSIVNFDTNADLPDIPYHPHDIWFSPYKAEAYITVGDQYLGGAFKTTDFVNFTRIFPEYPGFRLIPIDGGMNYQIYGIEAGAGTVVIKSMIDYHSGGTLISRQEVIMGKLDHSYAQFRCLKASYDGIVVLGTYSTDAAPADGGYFLISFDFGSTFKKVRVPSSSIGGIAITENRVVVGMGSTYTATPYDPAIISYSKEYLLSLPSVRRVIRPVRCTPKFGIAGGWTETLAVNQSTMIANMADYKNVKCRVTSTAGTIQIQGAYTNISSLTGAGGTPTAPERYTWDNLVQKTYAQETTETIDLSAFSEYSYFRVVNTGEADLNLRQAIFMGELI